MKTKQICGLTCVLIGVSAFQVMAGPVGTGFIYQGRLNEGSQPAHGSYDLKFTLTDAPVGATQVGSAVTNMAVPVSNGLFTVTLDFGPGVFTGAARWLEIGIRSNGMGGFQTLAPRQPLAPTPYAVYAPGAGVSAAAETAAVANTVVAGGITSASIASQQVVKSLNGLRDNVVLAPGANVTLATNGNTLTVASPTWGLHGNSGTSAGTDFLGTTDATALELRVGGTRAVRLEPPVNFTDGPNLIGGYGGNTVVSGVGGATIGGGGAPPLIFPGSPPTYIHLHNTVGGHYGTIGGGILNTMSGEKGFIGGGEANTIGEDGLYAVVPGGDLNAAHGVSSFAAGHRAKANHTGAFVWADSQDADFASTAANQLLIRAAAGVGINKNNPSSALDVNGTVKATSFSGSGSGLTGIGLANLTDNSISAAKLASDAGSLLKVSGGAMASGGASVTLFGNEYLNDKELLFRNDSFHGLGWYGAGKLFSGENVNGPALYGAAGGVLGTVGSGQKIALSWDHSQNVRVPGLLSVIGNVRMNDRDILFRGGSDNNHGLGWKGSFASTSIDGPVIYGWSGGALGATSLGEKIALRWNSSGDVFLSGNTTTKALTITGGADVAEPFPVAGSNVPEGSVMVIDPDNPGKLKLSDQPYDTRVAGVVSGANGVQPGLSLRQDGVLAEGQNVALTGRVYVRAVAAPVAIRPGDLLTTSGVPGHAMKATDPARAQGAVLGKAMTGLDAGEGLVLVLVSLQ